MKKNSINILMFSFINLLFLLNTSLLFSADIEIDDKAGVAGDQITFTVSINNAPKDIKGLQFNVKFDNNLLSFESKEDAALASSFDQFNAAIDPNNDDILIVAGISFGSGISSGTTGDLVLLKFKVNLCQDTTLELIDLKGDTAGLSTKNGQFTCSTGGPVQTPTPTSGDGVTQLTFDSGNDLWPHGHLQEILLHFHQIEVTHRLIFLIYGQLKQTVTMLGSLQMDRKMVLG